MFPQQSSDENYNLLHLLSDQGPDCPEKVKCQDAFSRVCVSKEEKRTLLVLLDTHILQNMPDNLRTEVRKYFLIL